MKGRLFQAAVGLGVSGVALWLTLRGKDLGAIWRAGRTTTRHCVADVFKSRRFGDMRKKTSLIV